MTSAKNYLPEICNDHQQESQFFCSCGDVICIECIQEHKRHQNFHLRNRMSLPSHFMTDLNEFKNSMEFITKNFDLNNFESNLINTNRNYFDRFFSTFAKDFRNLIEKVSKIIDYNNPRENSEVQMINFVTLNLKEKLAYQVLEKSKKIIEVEKLVEEKTENFLKDYHDLLMKHFPIREETNSIGNKLPLIKEEINEEGEEINLLVSSVENVKIRENHNFIKNFEESIDFTMVREEDRDVGIQNKNRFSTMKVNNTTRSTQSVKYQKKCIDCETLISTSEDYKVRCWNCYNKYKNKNK